jgi:hypothetical protein
VNGICSLLRNCDCGRAVGNNLPNGRKKLVTQSSNARVEVVSNALGVGTYLTE